MLPRALTSFLAAVDGQEYEPQEVPQADPNNATIQFRGEVLKGLGWLAAYGFDVVCPAEVGEQLQALYANDAVESITIEFDSPGGAVDGVAELADLVAASPKPVHAVVDGMCCSAAYWVASQCASVSVDKTSVIGSIGVFQALYDESEMFGSMGVKAHVVSSHELKGAGAVPGAEITENQLADVRRNVNTLATMFKGHVASGRGFGSEKVESIATGQVWIGREAVENGLADSLREVTAIGGGKLGARASATVKGEQMPEDLESRIAALEAVIAAMKDEEAKPEPEEEPEGKAAEEEKEEEKEEPVKEEKKEEAAQAAIRSALFAAHKDRVTPQIRKAFARIPLEDLAGALESLPVAVRTEPVGKVSAQIDQPEIEISDLERKAARFFGADRKSWEAVEGKQSLTMADMYPEKFADDEGGF